MKTSHKSDELKKLEKGGGGWGGGGGGGGGGVHKSGTYGKRCCVCLHMISRFYEIDTGCIVVNEIDVILKLLTWARKYNILFHKNKTILLLCKSFFVKVFTFASMLAFHIRV